MCLGGAVVLSSYCGKVPELGYELNFVLSFCFLLGRQQAGFLSETEQVLVQDLSEWLATIFTDRLRVEPKHLAQELGT